VVIGNKGALVWHSDEPVVPNAGGQGEEALGNTGEDTGGSATAVLFEGELAFEGVEYALDPLPNWSKGTEPMLLALAVGPDQFGSEQGDMVFEEIAGEAFIAEDDLAGLDAAGIPESLGDLPLAEFGIGQAPGDGHSVRGGEQVELEAPVVAGMAGAVTVVGDFPQSRTLDRLAAGPTGQSGSVEEAKGIAPRWADGCQVSHDAVEDKSLGSNPFVVAGRMRQIGEQMPQPTICEAEPAMLRGTAEQDLGHGETDQFGIREMRLAPPALSRSQKVIDGDVECCDEGVDVCFHKPMFAALTSSRLFFVAGNSELLI
jgi:hypothetical protein